MKHVLDRQTIVPGFAEFGVIWKEFVAGIMYLLSREGRLIAKFYQLKKAGNRSTPAVVIKDERASFQVLEAPSFRGDTWKLFNGDKGNKLVYTNEILELDTARHMAGYD